MVKHKDNIAEQIILEEQAVTEKEKLQNQLSIAYAKLRGEVHGENGETRDGLEKGIKELEVNKSILNNEQDYDHKTIKRENVFTSWMIDYPKQLKKQNANTDSRLAEGIFELLRKKISSGLIVDIGSGDGSLVNPGKEMGYKTFEIDMDEKSSADAKIDFFSLANWSDINPQSPSLVLCNPPFQFHAGLEKITELFGKNQPIVFFSRPDQRIGRELKDEIYQKGLNGHLPEIKSIVTLYLRMREDKINYNCEVWIFGIEGLKPHYFFQPLD